MRKFSIVLVALACAGVIVACGESDNGGSSGGSATGKLGTGLELGSKVLRSAPVGTSTGPWYVWNNESCSFETTNDHPAAYKADVREVIGGDTQIGYMHFGNTEPFGVSNSKSVEEVAELAEMPLDVYNLKFPSRTEPLADAKDAIVKQNKGVLQANLDPTILPSYYKILEGEGCIPSVQMYIPVDGHPAMGANWPDVGAEMGAYAAEEASARGWDPAETALVQCTDPDNGPEVNVLFDKAAEELEGEGFGLPSSNVFDLVCKLAEAQAGQKRVTDWFTANPDFKNVIVTSIDSPRMQSIIKGVQREGIPRENTLLIDSGLDPDDQKSVRAGDQDMSVAFFPERYGDWLIPMLQDVMAGNPVPKFVGTELVRGTADNIEELYPAK